MNTFPLNTYPCRVTNVVDGDTVDLEVDLGFCVRISVRMRLLGIDTAEVRGAERQQGLEAKSFVKAWTKGAAGEFPFLLTSSKKDSFGRWLGTLSRPGGEVLNETLVERGFAVPYRR